MKRKYLLLLLAIPLLCAGYLATRAIAQSLGLGVEISLPDSRDYYNVEDVVPVTFTVTGEGDWEADIDGEPVESGDELELAGWTVGQHTLTVRATDSSGQEVTNTVTFTVNPLVTLDPRVLNLAAAGRWITCYIEGLGVEEIDPETIMLTEINGRELEEPILISTEHDPEVTDGDGLTQLMVKFDRDSFIEHLLPDEAELQALLAGETVSGELLEAEDTITVVVGGETFVLGGDNAGEGSSASPGSPSPGTPAVAGRGQGPPEGTPAGHPLGGPPGIERKEIIDPETGEVVGVVGKSRGLGIAWGARALPRKEKKNKD